MVKKVFDLERHTEYFSWPSKVMENVWYWDQVDLVPPVIISELEYVCFLICKMGIIISPTYEGY